MSRKKLPNLGDLVYIAWEDSRGYPGGWERADEARAQACSEIESVGWVLAVGGRTVQVVPHVAMHKALDSQRQ